MQAKLPDVNHAIVTSRNGFIAAMDRGDPGKAEAHLRAIIALLPPDYRIEISTEKYKEKVRSSKYYICIKCKREIQAHDVIVHNYMQDPLMKALTYQMDQKVWICPACSWKNVREKTEDVVERNQDPSYLGVIPERPVYHSIYDRQRYAHDWRKWAQLAFQEIENKIGHYRTDYAAQSEDIESETEDEEGGEEENKE